MIRSGIACLAMIATAGPASAQLAVHELEHQPSQSEVTDLFMFGQGDLLLRMRERRDVIYMLAPDGNVKDRADPLSERNGYEFVPYRNGFAMSRVAPDGSEPVQIVAYESPTDTAPKVLYESPGPLQLYAAPDGQDLYVLETHALEARPQVQITRIDSGGHIAWQKTNRGIESSSFVATDDGVAFAQYVPFQNPARALRALDREGQVRWEKEFAVWDIRKSIYSAAGFFTLVTDAESEQARNKPRLLNFDARTGQLSADVVVEPFAFATGTKDGLLIGGWLLRQAYVATLDRKGKYVWLRRYVPDNEVGDIQQGAMTRDGKLLFVTRGRVDPELSPTTSVVVTDGTAAALGTARGGCLNPEWQEAADLVRRLGTLGIAVATPKGAELKTRVPRCMDRETRFIAFIKTLAAAIPAATMRPSRRQQMYIQLTAHGEPIRLESYSVDHGGGMWAGGTTLSFTAPYDGAQQLWKIVSTQVYPHLDRMQELRDRFAQMTGFRYRINVHGQASVDATLTALETNARLVDQRIATIAPDTLAAIRRDDSDIRMVFTLSRDGFGRGDGAMFPAAVADRTFLDIVQREAAARGDRN